MPGCAAVGCNNRSEKGYVMKCFPRDPKLRRIWQERVARADWEPSNNSFLCHVHFKPQEWSVTQTGRIRLKKNAIPSIFTVTSTRKSPKKRIKLTKINNKNVCKDECATVYLENDTEYSSTGHIEEKDSDFQDADDPFAQSLAYQKTEQSSPKNIENIKEMMFHKQYGDIVSSDQQENIIIISDDDNREISNITEENNAGKQDVNIEKKLITDSTLKLNCTNDQNEGIMKTEVKQEILTINDNYDEIEEKLKQICDGYPEEDAYNNAEKLHSISENDNETSKTSITQNPYNKSINYKYSLRNKIEDILHINDMENVEIIFGTESEEERAHKCVSYNKTNYNEINKSEEHSVDIDHIDNNKESDKMFSTNIEDCFNKENIHVTPNMKAAMKRKRRTREEIMKSIKKSIRNTSYQNKSSLSNSDISDSVVGMESDVEKEWDVSENTPFNRDNVTPSATKFTVKVTGDPDDVFDIMHDSFNNTRNVDIQECNNISAHEENNEFITSVITIEDHSVKANVNRDEYDKNTRLSDANSILSGINDQLSDYSTIKNDQWLGSTLIKHSDKRLKDSNIYINSGSLVSDTNSITDPSTVDHKYKYQNLQQKVKIQEDVIKKLTNQLILYKDSEKDLQSKNLAFEVKSKESKDLKHEYSIRTSCKKNVNSRQKLIIELSNKISYLEETNKKLMKNITVESQQKRKLEGQIKQRDNQIKELNWKLEKASKFLERSERNTNTYRRKMLNMQTTMRRKKLLDEKLSQFNEMLMDGIKEGDSEKTLRTALEIKRACGKNGYDKLLDFGFPLPPLSTLETQLNDNSSDFNERNIQVLQTIATKHDIINEYDTEYLKNDVTMDIQDDKNLESTTVENISSGTETVTGTVQDIFEENNDGDDFSTNELKEHFILQLNAVM